MNILQQPEFWVAVGFVAVIALFIWRRVPSSLAEILDARRNAIAKELEDAKRLREEAKSLLHLYQQRAATAEAEAQLILVDAKAEAERFAQDAHAQSLAQIQRRTKIAQEKIANAESAAIAEIRMIAADVAVDAAEILIGARIDDDRASKLISDSISELPAKLA